MHSDRKNIKRLLKQLRTAIKLNQKTIKYDPNPHQRDVARCRINIINGKISMLESRLKNE